MSGASPKALVTVLAYWNISGACWAKAPRSASAAETNNARSDTGSRSHDGNGCGSAFLEPMQSFARFDTLIVVRAGALRGRP